LAVDDDVGGPGTREIMGSQDEVVDTDEVTSASHVNYRQGDDALHVK